MSKKSKQKPGVRTKLNSGDKKVKKYSKSGKQEPNVPNPTAQAASKKLPEMELSTDTNWVAETSSTFMLSSDGVVASERTIQPETITYLPVEIPQNLDLPAEIKEDIARKVKENNKAKSKKSDAAKTKRNKYKSKSSTDNILESLKTYITSGVSEAKIDYEKLNQIQAELQGKISKAATHMSDKMEIMIDTASSVASAGTEQIDKIKLALQANLEEAKKAKAQKEEAKKSVPSPVQPETAKTIIPEKAAENPELTRAIQSEKAAQTALEALKEQLSSAKDELKRELEEKIAKKQKQLDEAQAKIKTYKLDLNG